MKFGIRTLFVVIATCCIVVAYFAPIYRNERLAISHFSQSDRFHADYEKRLPFLPSRVVRVGFLNHPGLDPECFRMMGNLRRLRSLRLLICSVSDDDISSLRAMPSLQELTVSGCRQVSDTFVEAAVRKAPNLRILELEATAITNRSLKTIASLNELETLILSRNRNINGGIGEIARQCVKLTKLDLTKTTFCDESLVGIDECMNLAELSLRDTLVTDASVSRISQIGSLKRVSLWGTDVSEDGVRKLKRAIPGVKVEYRGRR